MLPCLPIPIRTTKIFTPSAMDTEPCLLAYCFPTSFQEKKIQIKNKTRNCNEDIIPICNNNNKKNGKK